MQSHYINIAFTEFPDIKDSVKTGQPYYWADLSLHKSYKVINDYEKTLSSGETKHFILIVSDAGHFVEVPIGDNIKINFIG